MKRNKHIASASPVSSPFVMQAARAKQKRTAPSSLRMDGGGVIQPKLEVNESFPLAPTHPSAAPAPSSAFEQNGAAVAWTMEMDEVLREGVLRYPRDWVSVANHMLPHVCSAHECEERWALTRNEPVKGPWSPEEDKLLKSLVHEHGSRKWSAIALQFPGRSGKQCRERWLNHLDTRVKKSFWTDEEDAILCAAQERLGNRWSEIAKLLPGRAENAVKNRYNSIITKRLSMFGPEIGENIFVAERRERSGGYVKDELDEDEDRDSHGGSESSNDCTELQPQALMRSIYRTLGRATGQRIPLPAVKADAEAEGGLLSLDARSFVCAESGELMTDPSVALRMTRAMLAEEQQRHDMFEMVELTAEDLLAGMSLDCLQELEDTTSRLDSDVSIEVERVSQAWKSAPLEPKESQLDGLIPPPLDIGSPENDFAKQYQSAAAAQAAAAAASIPVDGDGNPIFMPPVSYSRQSSSKSLHPIKYSGKETPAESALRMSLNSLSLDDDDWNLLAEDMGSKTPAGALAQHSFKPPLSASLASRGGDASMGFSPMPLAAFSPMARYLHVVDQIPNATERRQRKAQLVEAFIAL